MTLKDLSQKTNTIDTIKLIKEFGKRDQERKVDLAKLTEELVKRHQEGADNPE